MPIQASTNWAAVGALATAAAAFATFCAVFVALWPIYQESLRRKSHARILRVRLCSKLATLRPSLYQRTHSVAKDAVLQPDAFCDAVRTISLLMQESTDLETDEQNYLGILLVNLESIGLVYGTESFTVALAKDVLPLLDKAIEVMSEHGLIKGNIHKPWES